MRVKLRLRSGAGQLGISHSHSPYQGTRGFTVVELLAIMAIIGILSGMVAGAVTGLSTTGINAQIISDTKTMETASDRFLNDSFPAVYPVETLPEGEDDLGIRRIDFDARLPQGPSKTFTPDFFKDIPDSASLALDPGAYGELELKQNTTLRLSAGQYAFEKIKVDKNSVIDLNLTNGQITVDVAGDINFQKSVTMDITSPLGSASDVKFRAQNSIDAHKNNELAGTFLSLGGKKEAAITWPSAVVRVMDVFQVGTTNANGEIGSFEA